MAPTALVSSSLDATTTSPTPTTSDPPVDETLVWTEEKIPYETAYKLVIPRDRIPPGPGVVEHRTIEYVLKGRILVVERENDFRYEFRVPDDANLSMLNRCDTDDSVTFLVPRKKPIPTSSIVWRRHHNAYSVAGTVRPNADPNRIHTVSIPTGVFRPNFEWTKEPSVYKLTLPWEEIPDDFTPIQHRIEGSIPDARLVVERGSSTYPGELVFRFEIPVPRDAFVSKLVCTETAEGIAFLVPYKEDPYAKVLNP